MAYAAILPTGPSGPGRQEYGGMRFPWQGRSSHGAGASLETYDVAARSSPRCPRRGAQRSAGTVAMRVHRVMRREPAPARGRGRLPRSRTGAGTVRTGTHAIALSRHFVWPSPQHAYGVRQRQRRRHAVPSSVPVFCDRCNCNEKSVMTAYTAPTFPRYCAIGLSAARPRPSHTGPAPFPDPGRLAGGGT